ncbi:MAG: hypothetical protein JSV62_07015 [Promethearchaeota archaeon]|nr:MAG: hypothetical protein JSV62_07015 [Candidatus Lokiarchaeota archaeon]
MNSVIYKVIFRAQDEIENKNLTLSFKNLDFEKPISIPAKFIIELKKISENNNQIINFQNIEEVITVGNPIFKYSYNYYIVVLFTIKSDGKKVGFLIGNVKNIGDIIIGIWPFNIILKDIIEESVLDTCNDIIENPNKYSGICLISQ